VTTIDYAITITDGVRTETLTSSPFQIIKYLPNPPTSIDSISDEATVTESIELELTDGSTMDNNIEVNYIEQLFNQAQNVNGKQGQGDPTLAKVYITMKNSASGTVYRSEIMSGYVDRDEETLRTGYWDGDVQHVIVYITRRYYWETNSEVQLELDNHLEVDNITGLTIYNPTIIYTADTISFDTSDDSINDTANGLAVFQLTDVIQVFGSTSNDGEYNVDGSTASKIRTIENLTTEIAGDVVTIVGLNCNYVSISADQAGTVVDAPVRLEITNAQGASISYEDIHIGMTHMPDIANFTFFFEGEDATDGSGVDSSTTTESIACSGGYYNALVWSGDTEKELCTWTMTAAMLAAARGSDFLGIIRLQAGTINTTLQLRLSIKLSTTTIWQGQLVTAAASKYMQELGIIQLPPSLWALTAPKALTLALSAKQTGGGTINLDFLHFMPVANYRNLKQLNYAVANGEGIHVDDMRKPEITYGVDGSANQYQTWIPRGSRLMLSNTVAQRIFILFDEQDNTQNINRKSTVKAYWRPRRLTL
jgi:hypothetical protein